MDTPFFSIIIPVYNAEKYLDACFRSIAKQSFQDYEVIITDDGSKDQSGAMCDAYAARDKRVHVFHVKNGGPSKARNMGFQQAKGQYVFCCDNDDEITSNDFLMHIHEHLVKHPVQMLQLGATYYSDETDSVSKRLDFSSIADKSEWSMGDMLLWMARTRNFETSCWTKVIQRKFLIENSLYFDESLLVEDLDWNLKIFQVLKTYGVLNEQAYLHYYRTGSITSPTSPKMYKCCQDQIKTIAKGIKMYDSGTCDPSIRKALLSFLGYQFFITMGMSSLLSAEFQKSIEKELKSVDRILNYHLGRKQSCLSWCYKLLGYKITFVLVKYYYGNMRNRVRSRK